MNNNTKALMVTLGHNSSALYYNGIDKPIGYEEERLNGIKSSSAFPKLAIERIIEEIGEDTLNNSTLLISHWFDFFEMSKFPEKYFDHSYVNNLMKKYDMEIILLNENFTHHDAHAYSSKAFLNDYVKEHTFEDVHYIVADGFGNNQEVLSIYLQKSGSDDLVLEGRLSNYNMSLGLLYQFATAFCGMKENQDEYKFLGYESLIKETISEGKIKAIDKYAFQYATDYIEVYKNHKHTKYINTHSEFIDVQSLAQVREELYAVFNQVMNFTNGKHSKNRIIIGYFIQSVVENVLTLLISTLNIKNVCLSGGCFYNVKLNNKVLKSVDGFVSVIPLAGDQGAAIGMYEKFIGYFQFYDLCYGNRKLNTNMVECLDDNIHFCKNENDFINKAVELLENDQIVNIVSGSMEFGPRALCNTSTLALPTKHNVEYINSLNDRNTVMPMAPVILKLNISALFKSIDLINKTFGSNEYMIMTHDFNDDAVKSEKYIGVRHIYPDGKTYSGRPQVISDSDTRPIKYILQRVNSLCLINTSFNTHGTPILYSLDNCLVDFFKQKESDNKNINHLVILDV